MNKKDERRPKDETEYAPDSEAYELPDGSRADVTYGAPAESMPYGTQNMSPFGAQPYGAQPYGAQNVSPFGAQTAGGRDGVIDTWQRDAYNLSTAIPDFDFAAALRNDRFRAVLARGGSVFEAYAAMAALPARARRERVFQNAQNPRRGTGESSVNPAKLPDKDFKKYISKIKNK